MDEPLALTLTAAARALSVSPRNVRRLLDAGELQRIRIGRAVRVTAASLRAYVEGHHALSDNPSARGRLCGRKAHAKKAQTRPRRPLPSR
jgi:excisionase family DNA binding protein